MQERRKAFDNLGAILRQRDSLLQLQVDTLASFTSLTLEDSDVSSGHAKVRLQPTGRKNEVGRRKQL